MLTALAEKYAQVLGTAILASNEHEGSITFVLESGPKYTMTPASLQKAIEASGVTEAELIAALDASQGIPPRQPRQKQPGQSQPGQTKPAPPAQTVTETESTDDKPKRKPRAK